MSAYRIDFTTLPWDEGREGMRAKTYEEGGRRLRLVEFSTSEGFDGCCEQGHIGYVLEGGLRIEVEGRIHEFTKGDGLFLPPGPKAAHRAVSIQPGTRLLMVEDVD